MAKLILVVDDKDSLRELVKSYLSQEGYRVMTAGNGREALEAARRDPPDLILLDIMMPEMSGYDFLRVYTRDHETPIILLTAKLEESDKVLGLELGADDYITKPFGMRELAARVRAVMRRFEKTTSPVSKVVRAGEITLNKEERWAKVGEQNVTLTPTEFDLLAVLISAPGRVYTRQVLLEETQGPVYSDADLERSINVHISNLRSKIEPDPANPQYILTVFGVGYRFNPHLPSENKE